MQRLLWKLQQEVRQEGAGVVALCFAANTHVVVVVAAAAAAAAVT